MTNMSGADLSDDLSVDAIEFRQRIRSRDLMGQLDPEMVKRLEAGVAPCLR